MFALSVRIAFAFVLALAPAFPSHAEDPAATGDTESTAPGKIGPGAPGTKSKSAKPAAAPSGIQVARKATISPAVHVHDKVLAECKLDTALPQMVADRSSQVTLVDSPSGGTRLDLKIIDIHAPSGGFFSGPKWITVEGRLTAGKTLKGDFVAKQTSMASATACGMLHKVMLVMAGDIAAWLDAPSKDAKLGNAR